MLNKQSPIVEKHLNTFCTFGGLFYLLLARIDKKDYIKSKFQAFLTKKTGKKMGRYILSNNVDIVICYDTWSYDLIKFLKNKKNKTKIILDMSSIPLDAIKNIMNENIFSCSEKYSDLSFEACDSLKINYVRKCNYEIQNSDYYFVPSSFSLDKLNGYNISSKKIFVIPYGNYEFENKKNKVNDIVNFIYLGQVSVSKGFHYLLDAIDTIKKPFKLTVIGSEGPFGDILRSNNKIEYLGILPHGEIGKTVSKCDVFISPSLYDSFSFSLTESMNMGLPVIVTENVGAKQYVTNGESGYIVPPMNAKALKNKIEWFIDNKESIMKMGEKSKYDVIDVTWSNYNMALGTAIKEITEDF
ncbi:glycosyltransferase [bacterium]|nr:glycosyltransferase [bacterium]